MLQPKPPDKAEISRIIYTFATLKVLDMSEQHNYVVILASGIGSRFWPESRQQRPKQFLDLLGVGCSMLQSTYRRFSAFLPEEHIYVVTQAQYAPMVLEQLPEIAEHHVIKEPSRKNTASSAAYAAFKLHKRDPKANVILSPVDHVIRDENAFIRQLSEALAFTEKNEAILTLGIKPTRPDAHFGYIQFQTEIKEGSVYKVKTFTEKPNIDLARTFLKSGDFLWNSGISIWKTEVFLSGLRESLPEIYDLFSQAQDSLDTDAEKNIMQALYPQLRNISLAYGLLEHAPNIYVLPSTFGWNKLSTWESVYEQSEKDYLGNVSDKEDDVLIIDASSCLIKTKKNKLVVLQGLDEYIIVDSEDVLLICERDKEEQIKAYMAEVRRNKKENYL